MNKPLFPDPKKDLHKTDYDWPRVSDKMFENVDDKI